MERSLRILGPLAALALVLAACGDDGVANGAPADGEVTVITTEFEFEPDTFTIAADTDVTVNIDNTQAMVEHDLTVDELDVEIHADVGDTASGIINAPAGTYDFYCSIPGHRESGMVGVLTVE